METAQTYLNPEEVSNRWGKDFAALAMKSYLHFSDTEITVDLAKGTTVGEKKVTQVTVREPTVADMKFTDRETGDIAKSAVLLRVLSDLPQASIDRMSGRDFVRCQEVVGVFLANGQ